VARYITPETEHLRLRSNPWSTGDGFLAAMAVGAKTTAGLDGFYGHDVCGPAADIPVTEFSEATQYYGPMAVALDASGDRFTDESESVMEETLAQDTLTGADGVVDDVLDDDVYHSQSLKRMAGVSVSNAAEYGGHVAEAESLKGLRAAMASWPINESRAIDTLRTYNERVRDAPESLNPPRRRNRTPLDMPPYYAVRVEPGITFTMGRLDVTPKMQVLSRPAGTATIDTAYVPENAAAVAAVPIPGLFAAGVDVGNVSHRRYMGGLAQSLVTGRIAGRCAAGYTSES